MSIINQERRLLFPPTPSNTSYGTIVVIGDDDLLAPARSDRGRDDDLHMDEEIPSIPIACSSSVLRSTSDGIAPQSPPSLARASLLRRRTMQRLSLVFSFIAVLAIVLQHHHQQQQHQGSPPFSDNNAIATPPSSSPSLSSFGSFLFDNLGSLLGNNKRRSTSSSSAAAANPPDATGVRRSIILLRHAEAVPDDPYTPDDQRPLTSRGIEDADRLGRYLAKHGVQTPDWIFSSPSVRTSYTLELVRRHWAGTVPVAFESILYVLAFNDYFAFCAGLNFNFRRVLIVGHNPAILNTAKKLMKTQGIENFPTAGLMEITWTDQPLWRDLVPFTGGTTLAISHDSGRYWPDFASFNVTVLPMDGEDP